MASPLAPACSLALLLLALGADPISSTELAFAVEPSDHIAVQNHPLLLDCQVEGLLPIGITWRKNGVPLVNGESPFTLANGSLYFPQFQKLKGDGTSNEGLYDCMAQNHFGLVVSRRARIQAARGGQNSHLAHIKVQNGLSLHFLNQQEDNRPLQHAVHKPVENVNMETCRAVF